MSVEYAIALKMNDLREGLPLLTGFITILAEQPFLKGAVLSALLVAALFKKGLSNNHVENAFILRATSAILTAIVSARLLQRFLPHRDRPVNMLTDAGLGEGYIHYSSFPSDHAVLMTVVACIIFARDRMLGLVAAVWTLAIILLPRIYLGLHHPTDIIGGVLFGLIVCHLMRVVPVPEKLTATLVVARRDHKAVTAFFAFLFLFLMSTNFDGPRSVLHYFLVSILGVDMGL